MATTASSGRRVHNLGPPSRIPRGEGRTFRVGDLVVAVFHTGERRVYATQAACSHGAGPLADGLVGGTKIVCPLHGRHFDLATGEPIGHDCPRLRTYPVYVSESGEIQLCLDVEISSWPRRSTAAGTAPRPRVGT